MMRQLMSALVAISIIAIIVSGFLFYIQGTIPWELWWNEGIGAIRSMNPTEPIVELDTETYDFTFDIREVASLSIVTRTANTEIIGEERTDIGLTYLGPGEFTALITEKELNIEETFAQWQMNASLPGSLTIRLPNERLEAITCDSIAGSWEINNTHSQALTLHTGSGNIKVLNSQITNLNITTISGTNMVSNCQFNSGTIHTSTGDTTITVGDTLQMLQITAISGSVTCTIPEGSDYTINAQSITGTIITEMALDRSQDDPTIDIQTSTGGITIFTSP